MNNREMQEKVIPKQDEPMEPIEHDRGAEVDIDIEIDPTFKYLLLWGYIAVLASVVQFLIPMAAASEGGVKSWIIWTIAAALGLLISAKYINDDNRRGNYREIKSSTLSPIWGGFVVTALLVIALWGYTYAGLIYPMTGLLFTYALYLTTRTLGERWLYMGVAACAVFIVVFKFVDHKFYPLLMAVIVLLGNILPIHILISEEINKVKVRMKREEEEKRVEAES